MSQSPFVKSKYKRIKNDHYPTIDTRCVDALLDSGIASFNYVWDCCSINGSGILDRLKHHKRIIYRGKDAYHPNPFPKKRIDWIVSNPPYERGEVDKIIEAQVKRLEGDRFLMGVAMLLRTGFDHAKSYQYLFRDCPHYAGQIKLTFRPIWFKEKKASPIHNYVWHIWHRFSKTQDAPFVLYSK